MPDKVMQGVGQERFGMRQLWYEIVRLLSAGLSSGLWRAQPRQSSVGLGSVACGSPLQSCIDEKQSIE